jgi:hypothetical protein
MVAVHIAEPEVRPLKIRGPNTETAELGIAWDSLATQACFENA